MGRAPSPIKVLALLARARYAHHHHEPVYVTWDETAGLTRGEPPLTGSTLFGVPVEVDTTRAEQQVGAALADPAPPMDWETTSG